MKACLGKRIKCSITFLSFSLVELKQVDVGKRQLSLSVQNTRRFLSASFQEIPFCGTRLLRWCFPEHQKHNLFKSHDIQQFHFNSSFIDSSVLYCLNFNLKNHYKILPDSLEEIDIWFQFISLVSLSNDDHLQWRYD